MQEVENKKTFRNMMELMDLISDVDQVVKVLREKDVISEEEEQEITAEEAAFNKKSNLFSIIKNKDESALAGFRDALRATGNESAADKLVAAEDDGDMNHINPEVTVVSHHPHPTPRQPDQEGMALAVEIEQEFERIQHQQESEQAEADAANAEAEAAQQPGSHSFDQEEESGAETAVAESSAPAEDTEGQVEEHVEEDVESNVRVEITAPTESEPEVEPEVEKEEEDVITNQAEGVVAEIEEKVAEVVEAEEKVPESPTSRPQKQVTFGAVSEPEPKEFIIRQDEPQGQGSRDSESPSNGDTKSIVALNREKFEKSSPNGSGTGPQVKYSFAKKGGVAAATPSEEEPKESTVKNLRNFFQKLGSVDAEEGTAVLKRPGVRNGGGGAPNRRTMI